MVLQKLINVFYISDIAHAGYLDLRKDPSRTSPASICSDSVVTEHCSPWLTLTSEENSIAGSVACQTTSLVRLMLVYLTHYSHLRAIPSITGGPEDLGEDEKEEVTWFPIRWRLVLPSIFELKVLSVYRAENPESPRMVCKVPQASVGGQGGWGSWGGWSHCLSSPVAGG